MKLGDAIPPVVADADELVSDGESAAIVREILSSLAAVTQQLAVAVVRFGALVDQHEAAANSLASAARALEVPEQEAPIVNVTVEPAAVTVMEPPETEKGTRKRVVRDAQGLITEIIEEPL